LLVVPPHGVDVLAVSDEVEDADAVGSFPDKVADTDHEVGWADLQLGGQTFGGIATAVDVADDVDLLPGSGVDSLVVVLDRFREAPRLFTVGFTVCHLLGDSPTAVYTVYMSGGYCSVLLYTSLGPTPVRPSPHTVT
jgi:hypothetical protein